MMALTSLCYSNTVDAVDEKKTSTPGFKDVWSRNMHVWLGNHDPTRLDASKRVQSRKKHQHGVKCLRSALSRVCSGFPSVSSSVVSLLQLIAYYLL